MREQILIIGGGVIGLSLAYELAQRGKQVKMLERGQFGKEASWAGAGMLPPLHREPDLPEYHQLTKLSNQLHREWAERLGEETGIDTGYRTCGAIYLPDDSAADEKLSFYTRHDIPVERCGKAEMQALVPTLQNLNGEVGYYLPLESQLRNPHHLKALAAACAQRRVELFSRSMVEGLQIENQRIKSVQTFYGNFQADRVIVCSGAWSEGLLQSLNLNLQVRPVRGQMVLLDTQEPLFERIVIAGKRYLVPRDDGRVLVGSTEEDAGFEKRNTSQAVAELLAFANSLMPALAGATFEMCWAGLRPASVDKLPYLGQVPEVENLYIAAGHFRNGLQLSPGTARVMAELVCDERPSVGLEPFRVDRHRER